MSGFDIADEIAAGFADATSELGEGAPLTGYIIRTETVILPGTYPPDRTETTIAFPVGLLQSRYTIRDRQAGGAGPKDRRLLIAANTPVEPQDGDMLIVGAVEDEQYQIINVEMVAPGGVPLYFIAQVRK